jgi:hypothetical protein
VVVACSCRKPELVSVFTLSEKYNNHAVCSAVVEGVICQVGALSFIKIVKKKSISFINVSVDPSEYLLMPIEVLSMQKNVILCCVC